MIMKAGLFLEGNKQKTSECVVIIINIWWACFFNVLIIVFIMFLITAQTMTYFQSVLEV